MALEEMVYGIPEKLINALIEDVWEMRHDLVNEGGDDPHLYNKEEDSYHEVINGISATVYCGRVYSNAGWSHNCGISFHAWLSDGKCRVWSPSGHSVGDSKQNWGTCRALTDAWYNLVGKYKLTPV